MGLFDFLKTKEKTKMNKSGSSSDYSITPEGMLEINKLDFYGQYHKSENGQFILSWADSNPERTISGHREKGHGSYVLIGDGEIKLRGNIERPNDGNVSNNGNFILNDWMFTSSLKGIFYAFNSAGVVSVKHLCNANLLNNGISDDGHYAVCQTANNDRGDDGNKLFFFDLNEKKLVWSRSPVYEWADSYKFDTEQNILHTLYNTGRGYRYTFDGEFLDSELLEQDRIKFGRGYELLDIAKEKIEHMKAVDADASHHDEAMTILEQALKKDIDDKTRASVYRYIGEIHHLQGDIPKAIEHFEIAINLDSKVGVKRLLNTLRKNKIEVTKHTIDE